MNGNIMPYAEQWTPVTVSIDSSKIASGSVEVYKKDGLVYVYLNTIVFKAGGNNQGSIITGLPKAAAQGGSRFGGANTSENGSVVNDSCWIAKDTTVINAHAGTGGYNLRHYAYFVYPTNE
jgi:hypothetical protein